MILIGVSIVVFFLTTCLHVLIHRFLISKGIVTFKTVAIFVVGFAINAYILIYLQREGFTFSAIAIYGFLVADYLAFFASPYLDDPSPSSKLILLIQKLKKASYKDLQKYFSNEELIIKRINDLVKSNLISKKYDRYHILPKGKLLLFFIHAYQALIRWERVG